MVHRLPPLLALKTFEAAARLASFKAAAEELGVTPAAVSHQIKLLETHLGLALFLRRPRRVVLTEVGRELYGATNAAFEEIAATVDRLGGDSAISTLTLGVGPIFASRWLSPRLSRFWERYPNIHLRLHHASATVDFRRSDLDLAIIWGSGDWPASEAELLMRIRVTPVCSPGLVAQAGRALGEAELSRLPLIHQSDHRGWRDWLAAAGMTEVDPQAGMVIDDANVVLQAALEGQGVALGILPFVAEDLASGRLVVPFELSIEPGRAYFLVYPKGALQRPALRQLRDWLVDEVGG
jgi:LysR family glycine cleavage system transcriptional activator